MPIVNSVFVKDHDQIDGRAYVLEQHTDSVGVVYLIEYLAAPGADYQSIMTARATSISEALAEAEAKELLDGS